MNKMVAATVSSVYICLRWAFQVTSGIIAGLSSVVIVLFLVQMLVSKWDKYGI